MSEHRDLGKELNELKGAYFKEQEDHRKTQQAMKLWEHEARRLKVLLDKIADAELSK